MSRRLNIAIVLLVLLFATFVIAGGSQGYDEELFPAWQNFLARISKAQEKPQSIEFPGITVEDSQNAGVVARFGSYAPSMVSAVDCIY